ncbi:hypothetical protein ARMGADRAFT_1033979 [Armillaria gallica]|uniref:Uncharacterized protein n=1 Tax=Armillaria gallica TaxID=47427 RepID=A0A2H3DB64_ARMGA|nr:hypothetical protein ARMGADRAFT_1033979 [Armillaria gallica]
MLIGMLLVLLHVSLALFFAGLSVFLFSLGMKVAWLVSIIGAATYVAYTVALILPLVYPYCPFRLSLAFAGMSSATLKWLLDEYTSALMVSLEQQIQLIALLVPSPNVERELELYYRASADTPIVITLQQEGVSCFSQNPSRPTMLSSLTLHPMVWKELVDSAISVSAHSGDSASELELELMKIIVRPSSKGESREVTTIDKPTDEMREYILDCLPHYWPLPITMEFTTTSSFALELQIILALIFQMEQRLCLSAHVSNQKQLIETSLTIIECISLLLHSLDVSLDNEFVNIRSLLDKLYSLLSSEAFVVISPDLQPLAQKIFIILDKYHSCIKATLPDLWFYSVPYQCYLHSPMGGGE